MFQIRPVRLTHFWPFFDEEIKSKSPWLRFKLATTWMEVRSGNHYSMKMLLTKKILVIALNKTQDKKGWKWVNLTGIIWNILYIISLSEKLATFNLLSCKRWHQLNPPSDPGRHWLTFCKPTHPCCKHSLWTTPMHRT